ncbi:septum site-determining protein MinC [Psychrobacter sp. TAE2020]|uniref:septum site-determining protein MinC n=1 Tax=Psychrobacter sp. TAE2020 TaxID=2846762 RepID=UPI001C0FC98C|nr:septum site-determining protein MinC [Psychrobacter sp. TAE2020]MBU5617544.1 septum site-determining protein MinC [Psychrobacter sp. TAE2020]
MTILDTAEQATPALTFYGKMLTFSRLQITTSDLSIIDAQLGAMLSNKTSNIPVLIDSDVEQDLPALVELLWSWGLQPIGVVKGLLEQQARSQRLAVFPADGKRIERILPSKKTALQTQVAQPADNTTAVDSSTATSGAERFTETNANTLNAAVMTPETLISAEQITSLIYDQMLRSGQSLNHVGGDLILTNSINSGAEAITDNSLHVYGRAQGRLVAGATGDKDARIFCQAFNPSLVSVAGTYCLRDNLPAHVIDKSVQVRFIEGEGLVFKVMEDI